MIQHSATATITQIMPTAQASHYNYTTSMSLVTSHQLKKHAKVTHRQTFGKRATCFLLHSEDSSARSGFVQKGCISSYGNKPGRRPKAAGQRLG